MKIKVRKEHIDTAIERDSHRCMIADAIKSQNPDASYIIVDLQSIRFSNMRTGKRYTFLTPPVAQAALLKFDSGNKNIKPFEFLVQRPVVKPMHTETRDYSRPGGSAYAKKRKTTDKAKRVVVSREREFGLRKFTEK